MIEESKSFHQQRVWIACVSSRPISNIEWYFVFVFWVGLSEYVEQKSALNNVNRICNKVLMMFKYICIHVCGQIYTISKKQFIASSIDDSFVFNVEFRQKSSIFFISNILNTTKNWNVLRSIVSVNYENYIILLYAIWHVKNKRFYKHDEIMFAYRIHEKLIKKRRKKKDTVQHGSSVFIEPLCVCRFDFMRILCCALFDSFPEHFTFISFKLNL